MARRPVKKKTKSPEQSGSVGMEARLVLASKTRGADFVALFCSAVEAGSEVPREALVAVASALRLLVSPGSTRSRLDAFAKELAIGSGKRGRPADVNEQFRRALNYWFARDEGMSHEDAIAHVAAGEDVPDRNPIDESNVAKTIRKFPEAESMAKHIIAEIDSLLMKTLTGKK